MKKIELLAPAGNMSKLKTAFKFGADACYFAGKRYGLRAFSDNFDEDEMLESVEYAHKLGKKVYITINIIAHNTDFDGLIEYVKYLEEIKVDGVIVADIGVMSVIREVAPDLEVHISTQANITNVNAAKAFVKLGAKRLVLARELSLKEIRQIADSVEGIDIEAFVHGAMCISYSGRCLLSNYFTNRDSNRGACVQACRWNFALAEKNRDGQYYPILEDEKGTYILNSRDINMISHVEDLIDAGINSFKIEGRMKTDYYVATVVNAYRRVLDKMESGETLTDEEKDFFEKELRKASNRTFGTGFYYGRENIENTESSSPMQTHEYVAYVLENNGDVKVQHKNKFSVGDELEILSPDENFNKTFVVEEIINSKGENVSSAINVQEILTIKCPFNLKEGDLLRKVKKT